jgi:hypothetical protein
MHAFSTSSLWFGGYWSVLTDIIVRDKY